MSSTELSQYQILLPQYIPLPVEEKPLNRTLSRDLDLH